MLWIRPREEEVLPKVTGVINNDPGTFWLPHPCFFHHMLSPLKFGLRLYEMRLLQRHQLQTSMCLWHIYSAKGFVYSVLGFPDRLLDLKSSNPWQYKFATPYQKTWEEKVFWNEEFFGFLKGKTAPIQSILYQPSWKPGAKRMTSYAEAIEPTNCLTST